MTNHHSGRPATQLEEEMANAYCALQDENEQLKARVAELEMALRPFADAGSIHWTLESESNQRAVVVTTRGKVFWNDLIRAAVAMNSK